MNDLPFLGNKSDGNGSKIAQNSVKNLSFGVILAILLLKFVILVIVWQIWNFLSDNFGWPRLNFFEFFCLAALVAYFGGLFTRKSYIGKDFNS